MADDWFSVSRTLLESDLWKSEVFTRGQAWVDLIGLARWKAGYARIRGHKIELNRGQLCWSEVELAKRWGWSRNKLRRFLNELKTEQRIEQVKNSVTTTITVKNYNSYQTGGTANGTADDTGAEQLTEQERYRSGTRKKKENKDNNEKKGKNVFIPPNVEEVSAYCKGRGNSIDPERFHDYHVARGWKLSNGKTMKEWKAVIRTWEKNEFDQQRKFSRNGVNGHDNPDDYQLG